MHMASFEYVYLSLLVSVLILQWTGGMQVVCYACYRIAVSVRFLFASFDDDVMTRFVPHGSSPGRHHIPTYSYIPLYSLEAVADVS